MSDDPKADEKAAADAKAKAEADLKAKAAKKPIAAEVKENLAMKLVWLDADGKPMNPQPKPDEPPSWSEVPTADKPVIGSLTIAPDGLSAVDTISGPGADMVTVEAIVGGVPFTAARNITVPEPAKVEPPKPQVLTSVEIVLPGEEDSSNLPEWSKPTPRSKAKP